MFFGGDIADLCYGIEASGNSTLNLSGSAILSGLINPSENLSTETISRALFTTDANINSQSSWFHSGRAVSETCALRVENTNGSSHTVEIVNSTLIAEKLGFRRGSMPHFRRREFPAQSFQFRPACFKVRQS